MDYFPCFKSFMLHMQKGMKTVMTKKGRQTLCYYKRLIIHEVKIYKKKLSTLSTYLLENYPTDRIFTESKPGN